MVGIYVLFRKGISGIKWQQTSRMLKGNLKRLFLSWQLVDKHLWHSSKICCTYTSWWLHVIFNFQPYLWTWSQFDEHVFQMGWFNHQLVIVYIYIHIFICHLRWTLQPFNPMKSSPPRRRAKVSSVSLDLRGIVEKARPKTPPGPPKR